MNWIKTEDRQPTQPPPLPEKKEVAQAHIKSLEKSIALHEEEIERLESRILGLEKLKGELEGINETCETG